MEAREREQTQAREDLVSIIRIQVRGREGELFSWIVWVPSTVELPSTNNKTKSLFITYPSRFMKFLPPRIFWKMNIHKYCLHKSNDFTVTFIFPIDTSYMYMWYVLAVCKMYRFSNPFTVYQQDNKICGIWKFDKNLIIW